MVSMLFWQFKLANSRKIAQKVPHINNKLKIINIKIKKRVEKIGKVKFMEKKKKKSQVYVC